MRLHPRSFLLGLMLGFALAFLFRLIPSLNLIWLEILFGTPTATEVEQSAPSPDGALIAYVLVRDSGSTTAPSRHVAVARPDQPIPDVGNVFRARDYGVVSVKWETSRKLIVVSEAEVGFFEARGDGMWATLRLRGAAQQVAGDE